MTVARRFRARQPLRKLVATNTNWLKFYSPTGEAPPLPSTLRHLATPAKPRKAPTPGLGPTEAQVLKAVLAYLRRHPAVASVERSQSGVFREGERHIRVGFVGKLDVSGFLKGGRYFEIEVKRPGGKPTEAQAARIEKIKAGGGISGYVTSIDEAAELLK